MRRVAAALLILFVAVAGVAVCSRGVQACAAMMASQPDCCGKVSLARGDCCCPAKGERSAAFLPAGELVKAGGFNPLLATAALDLLPLPGPASQPVRIVSLARVQPPPETLIFLHTSLLL